MGIRAIATAVAFTMMAAATAAAQPANAADGRQRPVALVTGSTDGLGREVAKRLGEGGMHVIVHGRNRARGEQVVADIEAAGGSARFIRADLASLAEVRTLAETVLRDYDRLDLLINNAGIAPPEQRRTSEDGHELGFAINYLSGFLLTHLLLPRLIDSAPARIVNVSSLGQAPIDFDDVMLENSYSTGRSYTQSKLAQVMLTFDLAAELEGTGVSVNALHPATYMNTTMVTEMGVRPRSTVEEGADAVLHVATSPDAGTGRFFNGTRPARADAQAYDEQARARLRELSRRLTGID